MFILTYESVRNVRAFTVIIFFRQTNTVNYTYQAPKEYSAYNADHQQNGQSMPAPSQAQSSTATRELDDLMDSLSGFKVR